MQIIYTKHAVKEKYIKVITSFFPKMKIRYDPDADAMYITLRSDKIDHTKEIDENTIADFNKKGQVIGVEILFVKERNPNLLKEFQVENLIPA